MDTLLKDHQRYRWFVTSAGTLVVGGKNAAQNDQLLHLLTASEKKRMVMHTREPGSPFCVLLTDVEKITAQEREECAIFTGCFSRAWRTKKKTVIVDVFFSSNLKKNPTMNIGTWGVNSKAQHVSVPLKLVLTRQKNLLRAVPPQTVSLKEILATIAPGALDKREFALKLELELKQTLNQEEVLSALPAGGSKILRA